LPGKGNAAFVFGMIFQNLPPAIYFGETAMFITAK
jgi:hypothetical protein